MDLSFDVNKTALVVIDLQHGIVARDTKPHAAKDVIANSVKLADTLRAAGGTVVWVHVLLHDILRAPADEPVQLPPVVPEHLSELVPELNIQPTDFIVAKRQWGAFYGTNLEQILRRKGIETIILAGIATNIGVESTARDAAERGFHLVFAEDAMATFSAEMQQFAITKIFPRLGNVRSTEAIHKAIS